ncbi:MAG: hypothetical protein KGH75_12025 [Rhodospirillales bacterium]|nr:hypothetical protein [Rhodospirillales bacterium]
MRRAFFLLPLLTLSLAACESGNIKKVSDYHPPAPPPMQNPVYDPYAGYGASNAIWTPPVYDRDGTIVKPTEPSTQADRPSYETAPWATGAGGGSQYAPPGTF